MEVEFRCVECGAVHEIGSPDEVVCGSCKKSYGDWSDFSTHQNEIQHCVICRCRDLYIQKDFNRKVGVAIAVVGAILAPFTKWISLLVCALIDLILYLVLPMITVCYKCGAIYRDVKKNSSHEAFNLGINDRYRAAERK